MVDKTVGERRAAEEDALEAREHAKRAVHPTKFLAELRKKLGPDLDRRLAMEPLKTCACGSCPVCYYRYAERLLTACINLGHLRNITPDTRRNWHLLDEVEKALNRVDY